MGYVKIHEMLFHSSILEEAIHVRWVWICFLVSCDRNGIVYGTNASLARKANVDIEEFEEAIEVLQRPDPGSTSKEKDGRRIIPAGPNLWECVNYLHYRGLKDPVEERIRVKVAVRKHRAKKAGNAGNKNVTDCHKESQNVTTMQSAECRVQSAEADIEKTTSSSSSRKDDASVAEETKIVNSVLEFWQKHQLKPTVRTISDHRRSAVLARYRKYGWDALVQVLNYRRTSDFLNHEYNSGRGAPIDWVFGPRNFPKVLDGNYND